MNVSDCMKRNVASIPETATIADAAALCVERHVGMLPVIDSSGKPRGMVTLPDLMKLELPDFINLVGDVDFVHDFGAVETTHPDAQSLSRSVTTLMQPVTTVKPDCGLLRAYSIMLQRKLVDMIVVAPTGELIGLVSRVDIGAAVLANWKPRETSP